MSEPRAIVTAITEIYATDVSTKGDTFSIEVSASFKREGSRYKVDDVDCEISEDYSLSAISQQAIERYGLCSLCVFLSSKQCRDKLKEDLEKVVRDRFTLTNGLVDLPSAQEAIGKVVRNALVDFARDCEGSPLSEDMLVVLGSVMPVGLPEIENFDAAPKIADIWCVARDEEQNGLVTVYQPVEIEEVRWFGVGGD